MTEVPRVDRVGDLRARLGAWRAAGDSLALVPTMGNLHAGHLALVARARGLARRVVVSLFVNPAQFAPGEDFERYPRTLEADLAALSAAGADLAYVPDVAQMYPLGLATATRVVVDPVLTDILEGASRPGFFTGVAGVVLRLFNQVQPDCAVFGEKDYQQLLVVRRLVADLQLPIAVHAGPTVREADGLALSSRNAYLGAAARRVAPVLPAQLSAAARALAAGADWTGVRAAAVAALTAAGMRLDYLELRHADDLGVQPPSSAPRVLLAAVWLDGTRLIDNLPLPTDGDGP